MNLHSIYYQKVTIFNLLTIYIPSIQIMEMFGRVNVIQSDISKMGIIFQSYEQKNVENNFVTYIIMNTLLLKNRKTYLSMALFR